MKEKYILIREWSQEIVAIGTIDYETFKEEATKKIKNDKGLKYSIYKKIEEIQED